MTLCRWVFNRLENRITARSSLGCTRRYVYIIAPQPVLHAAAVQIFCEALLFPRPIPPRRVGTQAGLGLVVLIRHLLLQHGHFVRCRCCWSFSDILFNRNQKTILVENSSSTLKSQVFALQIKTVCHYLASTLLRTEKVIRANKTAIYQLQLIKLRSCSTW